MAALPTTHPLDADDQSEPGEITVKILAITVLVLAGAR